MGILVATFVFYVGRPALALRAASAPDDADSERGNRTGFIAERSRRSCLAGGSRQRTAGARAAGSHCPELGVRWSQDRGPMVPG